MLAWLDPLSRALVTDLTQALTHRHPEILGIVLYGSIARHDERPLTDLDPSDIDLLVIFDSADRHLAVHRGQDVGASMNQIFCRYLDAPRDVQVLFGSRTLAEWDPTFIANVVHDGIILWARHADFSLAQFGEALAHTG